MVVRWHYSLIMAVNTAVWMSRVISFEIIMSSGINYFPAAENLRPVSICLIKKPHNLPLSVSMYSMETAEINCILRALCMLWQLLLQFIVGVMFLCWWSIFSRIARGKKFAFVLLL